MTEEQTTDIQENATGKNSGLLHLWRWSVRITVTVLMVMALLLTAGRLSAPLLAGYQAEIERQLGSMLNARVTFGSLAGDWYRFSPVIDIGDLIILSPDGQGDAHRIDHLYIKPDVFASLFSGALIIDQVAVQEPGFRMTEDANGNWTLAGLASSGADYTDAILDFLLTTGRLQIVEADLALYWADGRELLLDNIYIDLSNDGNRHEALIQARIAGQSSPFQVLATIDGDPRGNFSGNVYLNASDLDLGEVAGISNLDMDTARLSGDVWMTFNQGSIFDLQANLDNVNIAATGTGDSAVKTIDLANASLQFSMRHGATGQWQAWVNDAEFDWQNRPWGANGIYADLQLGEESSPLAIRAGSINLAMVADVLDDLFDLPDRAAGALADLAPSGRLENLVVATDLAGAMPDLFLLQGNLADVAVGAWQGAPSGSGIHGYVEADSNSGFVEIDTQDFEVHLPLLFTDSWRYTSTNSRVHWLVEAGQLRVNSSVIDVSNDFMHGHVQFDLWNHRDSNDQPRSELILLIGILQMDASYKSLYLPTLENVRTTMAWLDEALLAGDITSSGFVSRTSTIRNSPANSGTVMSFFNVADASLKFLPDWPALTDINAFITQDNTSVDVIADTAEIEGIRLGRTLGTVRPLPEGASWLAFQGSATTTTQLGMAFLRNTPVRNDIGDFIDDWRGEGNIQVDINLGIPLNSPDRDTSVQVNVLSNVSTLTIPEYALSIDQLRGRVVYDSARGLSASALSGRLFDFPIAATIEPMRGPDGNGGERITGTRVVGSGRASETALQEWAGQPQFVRDVLNFASGEIDYLAQITIPYASDDSGEGTSLRLTSELLGLSLDLPPPFNKGVDNIRPLELLIDFDEEEEWISARFDNRVGANLHIAGNAFAGGNIVFGPGVSGMTFGPVPLEDENKLYFSGLLDSFDYSAWEGVTTRFAEMSSADEEIGGVENYIGRADVLVNRLAVIGQELESARTVVQRSQAGGTQGSESWLVSLENDLLRGNFIFPDDASQPWNIALDYLRFPESESEEEGEAGDDEGEEEEIDILEDVNPAQLPDLDFTTDELTVGDKHLGAWAFNLRTTGDAATISNLTMTTPDARIRDNSGEAGANIDWRFNDGMHTASFTGIFSAGDLARVLPAWGYDANVESSNAAFVSNLQWSGSPAAFSLKKAIGNVDMAINRGRFVDVDSGTSRLFGAFSFDSLVRRLQLDFSDLYEKGLAYDTIRGSLDFNEGIVATKGDLVIEAPSSLITINGRINLINETIDADMLVNVPLGQNLSVLAGILGAWPIAVSTYIASRIFKDQMDEFTTVLYRLEGPWENPTSGFEPSEEILEAAPVPAAEAATNSP